MCNDYHSITLRDSGRSGRTKEHRGPIRGSDATYEVVVIMDVTIVADGRVIAEPARWSEGTRPSPGTRSARSGPIAERGSGFNRLFSHTTFCILVTSGPLPTHSAHGVTVCLSGTCNRVAAPANEFVSFAVGRITAKPYLLVSHAYPVMSRAMCI